VKLIAKLETLDDDYSYFFYSMSPEIVYYLASSRISRNFLGFSSLQLIHYF